MNGMVKKFLCLVWLALACASAWGAPGDIVSVTIPNKTTAGTSTDGWYCDVLIEDAVDGGAYDFGLGTDNDPTNAKFVMTVTSQGYNAAGELGTVTRTLYGTRVLRKAYPNQTALQEVEADGDLTVRVALSDFVYANDKTGEGNSGTDPTVTIAAGWYTNNGAGGDSGTTGAVTAMSVTNNSTLVYPKVVGRWAWPGWELVTTDFLVEAVCFSRFAKNQKQIACIKFDAVDESEHSAATQTVTEMTISTRTSAATPKILVYAATIPVSALDQAEKITVNFKAYPWVGNAASVLDSAVGADGVAQPDERLGPLMMLNDKAGTYGVTYAVVDATSGNDTTGAASSTISGAESTPCATIGKGVEAIQAYNNTNLSRNTADAGIVLVKAGNYAFAGTTLTGGNSTVWVTIEPHSSTNRAGVVINSATGSAVSGFIKVRNITITASTSITFYSNATTGMLWLDETIINSSGGIPWYVWLLCFATNNTVTAMPADGFLNYSTSAGAWALVRGNTFAVQKSANCYAVIGNEGKLLVRFEETGASTGRQISENAVVAYNKIGPITSPWSGSGYAQSTVIVTGIAIVQNLVEGIMGGGQPLGVFSGDGSSTDVNHMVLAYNTFVGERINIGYNDNGTTARLRTNWIEKFNIINSWNNKDDTFAAENAARTGSWPVGYGVGFNGNCYEGATFPGEFDGLLTDISADPDYVSDLSGSGNAGGGDYHLGESSDALSRVPAGMALLPYDLAGTARNNQGDGSAGVYEMEPEDEEEPLATLPGALVNGQALKSLLGGLVN